MSKIVYNAISVEERKPKEFNKIYMVLLNEKLPMLAEWRELPPKILGAPKKGEWWSVFIGAESVPIEGKKQCVTHWLEREPDKLIKLS